VYIPAICAVTAVPVAMLITNDEFRNLHRCGRYTHSSSQQTYDRLMSIRGLLHAYNWWRVPAM